jgi:hypothetical protein
MANHPNRSTLSAVLASCKADRIEAGTHRDGSGVAHITPVINTLNALADTCRDLSSRRFLSISAERDAARLCRRFCAIHDQAARGELVGVAYDDALATARLLAAE